MQDSNEVSLLKRVVSINVRCQENRMQVLIKISEAIGVNFSKSSLLLKRDFSNISEDPSEKVYYSIKLIVVVRLVFN